ncbi:MAG: PAS domain-containing sensor histidine kinase [Flavobacteriales bacterium]|nr:PAS domain-containing sensor histidine kinase [Flavobacteriales bacterium]
MSTRNMINPQDHNQTLSGLPVQGMLVLKDNGDIQGVSHTAAEMLGFGKDEWRKRSMKDSLIKDSMEAFDAYLHNFKNNSDHISSHTSHFQVIGRDEKLLGLILEPMFVPDGDSVIIGHVLDNTTWENLEMELVRQKKGKEKVAEQLYKERELSDMKSRFVSTASHEFRTPLAGILSSLQLIKRYLETEPEEWESFRHREKVEGHLHKIEESVTNLTLIINDFLSLGKLEEDKVTCKYEVFDISNFLEETCEELKLLCKDGQEIEYTHFGDKGEVCLDSHILKNIVNNLISNAIKYSPEGAVVRLVSRVSDDEVRLEVQDEGIGIPGSEHKNVFRRFFRAANALNYQGTGLGLSIVRRYTDIMNGKITFQSQQNLGTTFCVTFPAKPISDTPVNSPVEADQIHT